jgi:hypothetical protein
MFGVAQLNGRIYLGCTFQFEPQLTVYEASSVEASPAGAAETLNLRELGLPADTQVLSIAACVGGNQLILATREQSEGRHAVYRLTVDGAAYKLDLFLSDLDDFDQLTVGPKCAVVVQTSDTINVYGAEGRRAYTTKLPIRSKQLQKIFQVIITAQTRYQMIKADWEQGTRYIVDVDTSGQEHKSYLKADVLPTPAYLEPYNSDLLFVANSPARSDPEASVHLLRSDLSQGRLLIHGEQDGLPNLIGSLSFDPRSGCLVVSSLFKNYVSVYQVVEA